MRHEEIERLMDCLVIIINVDDDLGGFASTAKVTFPDGSCSDDLKERYLTVMRPHMEKVQKLLARASTDLEMRLSPSPAPVQ
jgi:hypothetical protein